MRTQIDSNFKMKWKNIYHANTKQKKIGVFILLPDTLDWKQSINRNNDRRINLPKKHNNMYVSTNRGPKLINQNTFRVKRRRRNTQIHNTNTTETQKIKEEKFLFILWGQYSLVHKTNQ